MKKPMEKILALAGALTTSVFAMAAPVKVIFDTDMISDFDDVGALACLHALADAGECEILATVTCTRGNASVGAVEIINSYYGRRDLPVGCSKEIGVIGCDVKSKEKVDPQSPLSKEKDRHHYKYRKLLADYPGDYRYVDSDLAPDANEVYRKALASAPDGSVVICSVGFLTNMRRLLETKGDAHSPLDGKALVAKKVRKWVAMACKYPRGKEYNSQWDAESSRIALDNWPTPVVFSDWEYGADLYAGREIAEMEGPRNPVKDVFAGNIPSREEVRADPAKWSRHCFGMGGRAAWDETAVLVAVRGETSYFNVQRGTYRMVGDDGSNEWIPDAERGRHLRITEKLAKDEVGKIIDELICRRPKAALAGERWAVIDSADPADGLYTVSGDVRPEGANAWFEPSCDRLTRFDGSVVDQYLGTRYGIRYRPINPNLIFKTPPVGWMTWYAVKFDASDEVVMRNARGFMEKFRGYTDEKPVMWVDWEWFHSRFKDDGVASDTDMLSPRKDVYPRGMKPVADDLKAMGFTPALWVSVFSDVRTNALWKANPEWILGEQMYWCGAICGNPSAPGFCEEFVPQLFSLYKGWGYEAFKWDTVPVAFRRFGEFRDKGCAVDFGDGALRKCVSAVRKAVGDDCYVMSCSGEYDHVNLAAIDLFDGGRIGGDIFTWKEFRHRGVDRILSYLPFHNTVFWADADNLVLREEFSSEAQARTRVTIYALAGLPVTLGDEIAALDEKRIDMLRKAMPVVKLRAASMTRGISVADLLPLRTDIVRDFGAWQLRGWSNMTTNRTIAAELVAKDSAVWDFWNDRLVGAGDVRLPVSVAPGDTALYRVTPLEKDAPTLVSVSRHITQGGYELKEYAADAKGAKGVVRCPGGETVKVSLLLPEGASVVRASCPYETAGQLVRLSLTSSAREDVTFSLALEAK